MVPMVLVGIENGYESIEYANYTYSLFVTKKENKWLRNSTNRNSS